MRIDALSGVRTAHVAAAKYHSAAVDAAGRLYAWGHGRGGRLGELTEHLPSHGSVGRLHTDRLVILQVPITPSEGVSLLILPSPPPMIYRTQNLSKAVHMRHPLRDPGPSPACYAQATRILRSIAGRGRSYIPGLYWAWGRDRQVALREPFQCLLL